MEKGSSLFQVIKKWAKDAHMRARIPEKPEDAQLIVVIAQTQENRMLESTQALGSTKFGALVESFFIKHEHSYPAMKEHDLKELLDIVKGTIPYPNPEMLSLRGKTDATYRKVADATLSEVLLKDTEGKEMFRELVLNKSPIIGQMTDALVAGRGKVDIKQAKIIIIEFLSSKKSFRNPKDVESLLNTLQGVPANGISMGPP